MCTVFEAALNINKSSFRKMIIPIVILALFGTIMSTMLTAAIVFYGSHYFHNCTSIPFIESLTFGALISSIDPIAVLSVLSNMGMSDKDQIYVIIFGESLLNDGVAIVLFQTLMNFMDESMVIDGEAVYLATLQFLVIAFGSLFVGLASGLSGTLYFWLMQGIQTPLVEVIMFICWAFIPYYICDGIEWSGIVAIVAVGFFMDVYIIGNKSDTEIKEELDQNQQATPRKRKRIHHSMLSQKGFLSAKAKNHIRFVTEINSTLMETAIFAYLGIFLFNKRYHWSLSIPLVGIISCVFSRAVTVWFFSFISNLVTRFGSLRTHRMDRACGKSGDERNGPVIIDTRMQTVLIFAGLRGAMSFALVETVPMFDGSTGQGSRFKPELKAMTSACIMFTVFVLGGYTDYLLERVGMKPSNDKRQDIEMVSLMSGSGSRDDDIDPSDQWETASKFFIK
jgi:NhaP-type Na+/H+ or K+/H+ antiporter